MSNQSFFTSADELIEDETAMPRIAFFFGISIYMYLDDHGVPHCHAIYGDYAGSFSLEHGELLEKWHELTG